MSKGNMILLGAVGGAILGALLANYLMTERGRQLLDSARHSLNDLSGQASHFVKNNLSEIIRETTASLGPVVKEKFAQQVSKTGDQTPSQH
jgi:gas vesicle protein